MYYTGIDPFTGEEVATARKLGDRKLQRALLQFFKPENYFEVRKALLEAGRADLIGGHCDTLIPAHPPKYRRLGLDPALVPVGPLGRDSAYGTVPHRIRPLHRRGGLCHQRLAGQKDAAGIDAVLQGRELLLRP
jgi:hypothetical protein